MTQATVFSNHAQITETITFREMVTRYFRWKDVMTDSEHTRRAYRSEIKRLMRFLGEDAASDALNRFSLQQFAVELYNSGLKLSSRCRALYCVRDLVKWAANEGIYPENFALALKIPRVPRSIPQVPTAKEVSHMLEGGCPSSWPERDHCIIELLYCNLRVCELVALGTKDATEDMLLVRGKGKRERVVFLTPSAKKAVRDYLPSRSRLLKVCELETDALLVNKKTGERLTTRSVGRIVKAIAQAKGLPKHTSPVKLRKAYTTHMLDGGAPLTAVSQLLGHENLATTMRYVGGVNWKRMRESYDRTFKR